MTSQTQPAGISRHFDEFPLHRFLGLTVAEQRDGYARLDLRTGPNNLGGIGGSVHGGVLAALVDVAITQALFAVPDPADKPAGTADLNITYLRPAIGDHIFAEANVIKKGRQLAVVEVSIIDDQDRLCARGRALYAFRA